MKMAFDKLGVLIQIIVFIPTMAAAIIAVYVMWERVNEIYIADKTRSIRAVERSMCKAIATEAAPGILEVQYNDYRDVAGYDYNLRAMGMETKCTILGVDCVPCGGDE